MNEHVQKMLEEQLQLLSERSHDENIGLAQLILLSKVMAKIVKVMFTPTKKTYDVDKMAQSLLQMMRENTFSMNS